MRDNLGELVKYGAIRTKRGMTDHDSVDQITEQFFNELDPYLASGTLYMEHNLSNKQNQGKGTARAEAAGVIKWNLRQADVPMYGVESKLWQSWLAARYGVKFTKWSSDVLKPEVRDILSRHTNFYTTNYNISDAAAISLLGYAHMVEKARISVRALCRMI